jgi:hypothetical protein
MVHHLNKQNLRNYRLFKEEDRFIGNSTSWSEDYLMDKRSDKLNRKKFKISPRRHKLPPIEDFIKEAQEALDYVNS